MPKGHELAAMITTASGWFYLNRNVIRTIQASYLDFSFLRITLHSLMSPFMEFT